LPAEAEQEFSIFWLCESCCSTMTLRFDLHTGVKVVPLSRTAGDAFVIAAPEAHELNT